MRQKFRSWASQNKYKLFILVLFSTQVWAYFNTRAIVGQSVAFLILTLKGGKIFVDGMRFFSSFTLIFPYLVGKLGTDIVSMKVIAFFYGITFLSLHVGLQFFCYSLLKRENKEHLILVPLASYACGLFKIFLLPHAQLNDLFALAWPLIILISISRFEQKNDIFIFLFFTFCLAFSHEAALLPLGGILVLLYLRSASLDKMTKRILITAVGMAMLSCFLRGLNPYYDSTRNAYLKFDFLKDLESSVIWMYFFGFFFCLSVLKNIEKKYFVFMFFVLLFFLSIRQDFAIQSWADFYQVRYMTAMATRALLPYELIFWSFFFYLVSNNKNFSERLKKSRFVLFLFLLALGNALARDLVLTQIWNKSRDIFMEYVDVRKGQSCISLQPIMEVYDQDVAFKLWPQYRARFLFEKPQSQMKLYVEDFDCFAFEQMEASKGVEEFLKLDSIWGGAIGDFYPRSRAH